MLSRRVKIFYLVLCLIASGIVLESVFTKPRFELDKSAKPKLSRILGRMQMKFSSDYVWTYRIVNGQLIQEKVEKHYPWLEPHSRIDFPTESPEGFPVVQGYSYYGPYSHSPDKLFLISSLSSKKESWIPEYFAVIHMPDQKIIFRGTHNNWIDDIAWSPDSSTFAILAHSSRRWLAIKGLVGLFFGHPLDVSKYYLSVYTKDGTLLVRTKVASGLILPSAQVSWQK
jgi:hypothetical protein